MKRINVLWWFVLMVSTGYAQQLTGVLNVSGHVFVDKNGNGIRDANEPGVAGVAVSDQVNVVQTDAAGLPAERTQGIWICIYQRAIRL